MRVIIIDDDAIFTMMHSVMVKRCNLDNDPLTFLSAKEALEFLQAQSDSTKQYLILLDINMPEMDGWEFLMMLNNTVVAQKVKVAVVSSSISPKDIFKAKTFPQVVEYFAKPFSLESCEKLKNLPSSNS